MLDKVKSFGKTAKSKYKVVRSFFKETYNKHIIYMYIVIALLINLVIEIMARGCYGKGMSAIDGFYFLISSPYVFICNSMIILMSLSVTLLMRRRIFGISIISIIWIIFGISNAVLLSNRETPFTGIDLMLIDSAFAVMNKYFSTIHFVLVGIAAVLAIIALVFIFIKVPKVNHKIKYIRNIIAIALIWAIGFGTINLGIASGLLETKFGRLRDAYVQNGFVYCFTNSLFNTGIDMPDNYSKKTIKGIVEKDEQTKDDTENIKVKEKPNIIFLQLESFFDLNNMTNIKLSDNPLPNFEKLLKEYPSGYLSVPVVGAGTVNTEFEIMTGLNLDFFGPGEYPFKTKMKDTTCESICYNLKNYGYNCHAVHNNTATFYGRNIVFSNLGYDTFTTIENMYIDDFTPKGWAKDYYLTEYIMEALSSTKNQDFIYTISVQGHGSYPTDKSEYDSPFKVKGLEDEELTTMYEYYAGQINEMDQFIGQLTDRLESLNEDTILVMYGDHLPSLEISKDDLVNKDIYQTQYIIWSNFETDYEDEDIEAYELEAKILEKLNMTEGRVNNYNQLHRHENFEDYNEGLMNLAYDFLYGEKYSTESKNPYVASNLHFGLNDVSVKSVVPTREEEEGIIYIYGEYFTRYSKVYINGEKQKTIWLDPNTVKITYPGLKDGDSISVYQQNSDTHVLSKTEPYIYSEDEISPSNLDEQKNSATVKPDAKKKKKNK